MELRSGTTLPAFIALSQAFLARHEEKRAVPCTGKGDRGKLAAWGSAGVSVRSTPPEATIIAAIPDILCRKRLHMPVQKDKIGSPPMREVQRCRGRFID